MTSKYIFVIYLTNFVSNTQLMVANNIPSSQNNGLVSIIMPFKDTGKFLHECVQSIVDQEYKNWELLAVDDHSSDDSATVIQSFAQHNDNISYLLSEGQGIIPALQTGYRASKGDFITRMDSDDVMTHDKLLTMVDNLHLDKHNTLAVGKVKYIKERAVGEGYLKYQNWLNDLTASGQNFEEIYKECVVPSPAWMCSRQVFETVGGFEHRIYPEDYDLAFRFRAHGLKVIGTKDVVHLWRDYPNRTSRTHANYSDNSFLELKVARFISDDFDSSAELALWGAGKKGKKVAQLLLEHNIKFRWFTNNRKKTNVNIYGITLEAPIFNTEQESQVIVSVAGEMQNEIRGQIRSFPNIQPFYFA